VEWGSADLATLAPGDEDPTASLWHAGACLLPAPAPVRPTGASVTLTLGAIVGRDGEVALGAVCAVCDDNCRAPG
jgi:hypothetical protein